MYVLIYAVAMGLFIALHEAGHFVTARLAGMKVTDFFIGFGPKLWSFRRGETQYGLKAIPAGGFVRIIGMNAFERVDEADRGRTFHEQSLWKRVVVLSAGSAMHFVIALLLVGAGLALYEVPLDARGRAVSVVDAAPTNRIGFVQEGSPADGALQLGDEVVAIEGAAIADFDDLRDAITPRAGQEVTLEVVRQGDRQPLTLELPDANPEGEAIGFLGVSPLPLTGRVALADVPGEAVAGFYGIGNVTAVTVQGLGQAFSPASLSAWLGSLSTGERTADGPISIVGAGQVINALGTQGELFSVLIVLANLNVAIGLLNMLPLLPLDGGHVAVNVIEEVVRRFRRWRGKTAPWSLNPATLLPLSLTVFAAFALIAITAIVIDVVNPASSLVQ